MAIVPLTRIPVNIIGTASPAWRGLTTDDTGQPLEAAGHADKTITINGDFGTDASVSIYGSNEETPSLDDTDWFLLTDSTETAWTATSKLGGLILQNYRWIRPKVTGGTNPDIDVIISAKV